MPTLVSIQAGKPTPRTDNNGKEWTSGYSKSPIRGKVWVGKLNIAGDEQYNKKVHGGPDRAILAYSANHYPIWQDTLNRQLPYGAFAENLTIEGLNEDSVCIGDTYAIGNIVQVQVSQPRQPCNNISRFWGIQGLQQQVGESGRTGWYLRVLREGMIETGDIVRLVERPYPQWTISNTHSAMNNRNEDPETASALAECELLEKGWRKRLQG